MRSDLSFQWNAARLERAFQGVQTAVQTRPPATAAVLAVADDRQVIRCEAYSKNDMPTPASVDSIFLLASITKPIIALAIMQMMEDGLLALHQPIHHYLPDFEPSIKMPITIWNLLTHTSGMSEIEWSTALAQRPYHAVSYEVARKADLNFIPGTRFQYSTLSFYVLAELIARLSGLSYTMVLQKRIFEPLGMHDTSFDPRPKADRLVKVEGITADLPVSVEEATDHLIALKMPGAGLWSTASDLAKFGQALLNIAHRQDTEKPQLLSFSHLDLMTREHTAGINKLENDHFQAVHYGLAWRKGILDGHETLPGSPSVFEHDGATGGMLWIDPEWNLIVVFLTNAFGADATVRYNALQVVYSALSRY